MNSDYPGTHPHFDLVAGALVVVVVLKTFVLRILFLAIGP